MSATTLDFATGSACGPAEQGSKFLHQIVLTYEPSGQPIPITGDTFTMNVTATTGAATTVLALSTATTGITIVDGPNGVLEVAIPQSTMKTISSGMYVYDLARTPGGVADDRYVLCRGQFEVIASAKAGA